MTLQEYVDNLNKFLEENEQLRFSQVYYAKDDEGNDFDPVSYTPSHYLIDQYGDFHPYNDDTKREGISGHNLVVIN